MEIVFQERRIEKSILWKILSAVDNFLSRKLSILFSQSVRDFGRKSKWYDDELNSSSFLSFGTRRSKSTPHISWETIKRVSTIHHVPWWRIKTFLFALQYRFPQFQDRSLTNFSTLRLNFAWREFRRNLVHRQRSSLINTLEFSLSIISSRNLTERNFILWNIVVVNLWQRDFSDLPSQLY